ncbi:50S ribosomal protein L31 [Patescibacteria group bacterium]|nr:50S ribosomal protein L31 [Patescibacteria group bacterium]MBU1705357.1 50S ribosomal protein L31 [Patescibacteria group bacterium]
MKKEIHPEYFPKAQLICACGAKYEIGSTREEISIELCSACHPFYTGKQKIMDTARRVEKFQERVAKKTDQTTGKKAKRAKRATKKQASDKKETEK